jgi:hypothetical protein
MNKGKLIGKVGMAIVNQSNSYHSYNVIKGQLNVLYEDYDNLKWKEVIIEDGNVFDIEPEILTFETIRKECVSMKHLLLDRKGERRLYLGFNRKGELITDHCSGDGSNEWSECRVEKWTIEPYTGEENEQV